MSIWLSRRNKIQGVGSVEAELMAKGLVAARLRIEFAYYKMISQLEQFIEMWGQEEALCTIDQEFFKLPRGCKQKINKGLVKGLSLSLSLSLPLSLCITALRPVIWRTS